jgi:hypothetical protein
MTFQLVRTTSLWITKQILVISLLMIPGLIDLLVAIYVKGGSSGPQLNTSLFISPNQTAIGPYSMLFWCLFLVCSYISLKILNLITAILPLVVQRILAHVNSPSVQIIVDYVEELKKHIVTSIFLIGLTIVWSVWFTEVFHRQ